MSDRVPSDLKVSKILKKSHTNKLLLQKAIPQTTLTLKVDLTTVSQHEYNTANSSVNSEALV
jgi:hypothetical protein